MISIQDVSVAYGGFKLLDGISFHVSENDKIGLVGKNGAGKSTLLKLICGEQQPTSGRIDRPGELRIGYLPQIMAHHKGRSVLDETMTVFAYIGEREKELEKRERELGYFSQAVKDKKESWSDRINVSVKTMDRVIWTVSALLWIVFILIILEAAGVFKL